MSPFEIALSISDRYVKNRIAGPRTTLSQFGMNRFRLKTIRCKNNDRTKTPKIVSKPHNELKIATWNVNSLKSRLELVKEWLVVNPVDFLLLQEIKGLDEEIFKEFTSSAYNISV